MSHLTNIIRKELRELLTPGSVASVLIMVVLFAGLGGLIGGEVEKASAIPIVGVANASAGDVVLPDGTSWSVYDSLCSYYTASGVDPDEIGDYVVTMESTGPDGIIGEMSSLGLTSAILVDSGFATDISSGTRGEITEYYVFEPTGMFGTVSSTAVSMVIQAMSSDLSSRLISSVSGDLDHTFLMSPIECGGNSINTVIDGTAHPGVTPQDVSGQITSQTMMIPIIIMIIIMMVGSIVISSMGSEKENKTLETLLTLPIKRTTVVTGKIVAAALVGLVYGLAYMVGMSIYMGSLMDPLSSGVDLGSLGLSLDIADYALVMLSMFMSIICALGICMVLGAFAKNYKSAQTMTMPLSLLAMIPMFIVMFSGWYSAGPALQAVTFAIPFSHPMMAMQALMYGDVGLVVAGLIYMAVFATATILATVRLYNSDILITGLGQNGLVQRITGRK